MPKDAIASSSTTEALNDEPKLCSNPVLDILSLPAVCRPLWAKKARDLYGPLFKSVLLSSHEYEVMKVLDGLEKYRKDKAEITLESQANAYFLLGLTYMYPYWGRQDYSYAKRLFEKGISLSKTTSFAMLGLSYHLLGDMHMEGHGIEKNLPKAKDLLERAVEHGNATANLLLGMMYGYKKNKICIEFNPAKALQYFEQALAYKENCYDNLHFFALSRWQSVIKDISKNNELESCDESIQSIALILDQNYWPENATQLFNAWREFRAQRSKDNLELLSDVMQGPDFWKKGKEFIDNINPIEFCKWLEQEESLKVKASSSASCLNS